MLDLVVTSDPYPYFPGGGRRCNPDQGRGPTAFNGVEMEKCYCICGNSREKTRTQSQAEVRVLTVTHSRCCDALLSTPVYKDEGRAR